MQESEIEKEEANLGQIIAKVQDDLQYLQAAANRGVFAEQADGEATVDLDTLKMVLARTEKGMQTVAEKVLHSTQDNISTLPAVARKAAADNIQTDAHTKPLQHRRSHSVSNVLSKDLTAGQMSMLEHMSQLVAHPTNPLTHKMLSSYYDLPTDHYPAPTSVGSVPGQLLVGSTIEQLTTLPKSNRRDPLMTPPPISQTDAGKGLLSLLERGLIPPAAEIVLSPPPVQPESVRLHTPSKQHIPQRIADGVTSQLAGVKLDSTPAKPVAIQIPTASSPTPPAPQEFPPINLATLEVPDAKVEAVPEKLPATSYKVVIQNGCLVDKTSDFLQFEKEHQGQWHIILRTLKLIVDLCKNYAIPLCIIDGNSLVQLAQECELGLKPTREALLAVVVNNKDVRNKLLLPGQRFKAVDGRQAAAATIRATYLMYRERKRYKEFRERKWAAGVLSMAWLLFLKLHSIRNKLQQIQKIHLEAHQLQMTELRRKWNILQSSKRTIVHIASQSYPQHVRATITDFHIKQGLQMGRLCDIQDPNVEVIYVSPTPLTQDMTNFYYNLASMGPAGSSCRQRLHFVHPENLDSFKSHNLSLSTLVLYSPACLSRIKRLVAGREAYIVSGTVCKDDLALAYKLGIPLLGSEPSISHLYSTKAGAQQLLRDTKVATPPHKSDIVSQQQLLETLGSLVANNLLIERWILKLPDQVRARGFAYCDIIKYLPCYEWVVKEAERYGSKWTKVWAQEKAVKMICSYLPEILSEHVHVVDTELYPEWEHYLKQFLRVGGVIEGTPPSESVTPLAVDLLIEPTGAVKVLCTLDQICSKKYKVYGGSTPQTSVPHAQLMDAVNEVASACQSRGIVGHFSIDFVTFINPSTMCQDLWCVDLDLTYSNNLALYKLMSYLTGYQLDVESGVLHSSNSETPHYAVLTPHLYHTNLSLYYHSIFFQMCKAHFIGYDPKLKTGTVFSLADDKHKQYLGMISVQNSLLGAVQMCSSNLSIIHQEISTASMQGTSNFKAVVRELDKVANLITSNTEAVMSEG